MPDKWQEIKLRLDAELAQALRDLKRGHDESISEVVLRLLRKAVRQNPAARGVPDARSSAKGARGGRGTFGAGRRGKRPTRDDRGGARGAAPAKPFVAREPFAAREVAEGDTWAPSARTRRPARAAAVPRGNAVASHSGDDRSRVFRPGDAGGAAGGRTRRPRKAKGRTSRK